MLCEISYLLSSCSARSRRCWAGGSCLASCSTAPFAWPDISSRWRSTKTVANSFAILADVSGSLHEICSERMLVLVTGLTLSALLSVATSVCRCRLSITFRTTGVSPISSAYVSADCAALPISSALSTGKPVWACCGFCAIELGLPAMIFASVV